MFVCGIDEAGRGPLAGPVVSAAVVLEEGQLIAGAADSKSLSSGERERLYEVIINSAVETSVGISSWTEIDSMNILRATMLSMQRALHTLNQSSYKLFIDGNYFRLPDSAETSMDFVTVVKGDATINAISCASIIAKVTRDNIMRDFHVRFSEYGFDTNKGYPTPKHINSIRQFGICEIHRKTFCQKFVNQLRLVEN